MNEPETLLRHSLHIIRRYPDHDEGIVRQRDIVGEDHLFPDNWRLSLLNDSGMGGLSEGIQGLFECLPCCVQLLLCGRVLVVAVDVDFVSAGTEIGGLEHLCGRS